MTTAVFFGFGIWHAYLEEKLGRYNFVNDLWNIRQITNLREQTQSFGQLMRMVIPMHVLRDLTKKRDNQCKQVCVMSLSMLDVDNWLGKLGIATQVQVLNELAMFYRYVLAKKRVLRIQQISNTLEAAVGLGMKEYDMTDVVIRVLDSGLLILKSLDALRQRIEKNVEGSNSKPIQLPELNDLKKHVRMGVGLGKVQEFVVGATRPIQYGLYGRGVEEAHELRSRLRGGGILVTQDVFDVVGLL
eukprot:TRINITY_DN7362_c0_g2_i3.p1 TRINITY_DN7362_c0_g2~~TRINITY_DN7362_c0_g2_i3.p1  ORF type:complete len:244 (+),score=68.71 TRINITY_DN7362_c0_g2_i3:85-816(+)